MKKTLVLTLLLAMVCVGIYSCASQYPMLYKKSYVESRLLKEGCQEKELKSNTTIRADSLFTVATKLMKDGNDKEAYYVMELAVIHYRLALSYRDLDESKKKKENNNNLYTKQAEQLSKKLESLLETNSLGLDNTNNKVILTDEEKNKLKSLGYVQQ